MNQAFNNDISIIHLDEIPSTNDYLSQLCRQENVPEFQVVTAMSQTAGKGQRGNSWESEKGKNLLFSLVLHPTFIEAKEQFYLSMLIAICVSELLEQYTEDICIKWPNDIYWKDNKIAGILIENELIGKDIAQCIVGIGLNINQETFHSSAPNPISLRQISGKETDPDLILQDLLNRITNYYNELKRNSKEFKQTLSDIYLDKLYRHTGYHAYQDNNGIFTARFHHLLPDGHLCLEDEQGNVRAYAFKEVNYILS